MDNLTPLPVKVLRIIFLLITGYLGWHGYKMELKVEQTAAHDVAGDVFSVCTCAFTED